MVSALDNYLLSFWVILYMLGLPAKEEQQHWKFKQPLELDQGFYLDNDRNKRHKGSNGKSSIWDRAFERRKRQKGSKGKSITWDRPYEYRPRVGADSTETLFALVNCKFTGSCRADCKHTIGIYSPRGKCGYTLPPIPGHPTGIPLHCQCVSLDCKLYLVGGNPSDRWYFGSRQVYAIDLRHGESLRWEQKASMHNPRVKFGIGVMEGKIYVFGGISSSYLFRECEVYDPKENAWSRIKPMPSARHGHNVIAVGKELLVHGGEVLHLPVVNEPEDRPWDPQNTSDSEAEDGLTDSDGSSDDEAEDGLTDPDGSSDYESEDGLTDPNGSSDDKAEDGLIDLHDSSGEDAEEELINPDGSSDDEAESDEGPDATTLEIYNPEKDEWRMFGNWLRDAFDAVFVANGSVYAMGESSISRLDTPPDTANWVHFTRCPFVGSGSYQFGPARDATVHPFAIEALDGTRCGLVALAELYNLATGRTGKAILQSEVFSARSKVEWKTIAYYSEPLSSAMATKPFFCRIVF